MLTSFHASFIMNFLSNLTQTVAVCMHYSQHQSQLSVCLQIRCHWFVPLQTLEHIICIDIPEGVLHCWRRHLSKKTLTRVPICPSAGCKKHSRHCSKESRGIILALVVNIYPTPNIKANLLAITELMFVDLFMCIHVICITMVTIFQMYMNLSFSDFWNCIIWTMISPWLLLRGYSSPGYSWSNPWTLQGFYRNWFPESILYGLEHTLLE